MPPKPVPPGTLPPGPLPPGPEPLPLEPRPEDPPSDDPPPRAVHKVRTAWVELNRAARLAEQYRSTVVAISERNLTLAEAALKSGQADVTVLLDAQRELVDARRTLNDLERDAALARIALEQTAGARVAP